MRKKGNPRFKKVKRTIVRRGKRVKTTVYKVKRGRGKK